LIDRVIRDKLQHSFEPLPGINGMLLSGSKEGVKHGCPLGFVVGTGEQVILPPKCIGANTVFNQVVVYLQYPVIEINVN